MTKRVRDGQDMQLNYVIPTPKKPRVLLAATGCVATFKFGDLCDSFSEWAEVKAVFSKSADSFLDRYRIPHGVPLFSDGNDWASWSKLGDPVLHIQLTEWADVLVIAPLSAHTLAKIAGGLCDNLLTCIIRAWDYSKPLFVAPAMNLLMWKNPFTETHLMSLDELGVILIPPDHSNGAMAEPDRISYTVKSACAPRTHVKGVVIP